MKVTKDSTIQQVLEMDEGTAPIFMKFGMHCLGCPGARRETVELAAIKHGIDADEMLNALNKYFEA